MPVVMLEEDPMCPSLHLGSTTDLPSISHWYCPHIESVLPQVDLEPQWWTSDLQACSLNHSVMEAHC